MSGPNPISVIDISTGPLPTDHPDNINWLLTQLKIVKLFKLVQVKHSHRRLTLAVIKLELY